MTTQTNQPREPFGTHAPGFLLAAILRQTERGGSGWLSRRWIYFWRKVGVKLLAGRPADVVRLGCRLRLDPAHNTAEKRLLFTPQFFDPLERAVLGAELTPDFTFADVGANVGGYALAVAAQAGAGARIAAIEPQPDIHARLLTNVAQNGFAQIVAFDCAVSDRDGDVTLYINAVNKGESSLRVGANGGGIEVRVRARRLAPLLREAGFDRLDAMKIDVEGMEDVILADFFVEANRALWPRVLIVEDAPSRWGSDLPALITSRGYRRIGQSATNLIYRADAS